MMTFDEVQKFDDCSRNENDLPQPYERLLYPS